MYFSRPIKWYRSHADLILPDGAFNNAVDLFSPYFLLLDENSKLRGNLEWPVTLPPRLVRDAFAIQPSRVSITFILIVLRPLVFVCSPFLRSPSIAWRRFILLNSHMISFKHHPFFTIINVYVKLESFCRVTNTIFAPVTIHFQQILSSYSINVFSWLWL